MTVGLRAPHIGPARIGAGLALLMTFALSFGSVALAAPSASSKSLYIVQMAGAPIAAYTGDVKGFKATKPAPGKKVDMRSAAAKAYAGHLKADRKDVLAPGGHGYGRDRVHVRRRAQRLRGEPDPCRSQPAGARQVA